MDKSALIIGCGSIGRRHAKNLKLFDVDLSVFDIDETKQKEVATEVGASTVESVNAGIDSGPEMVFVATPSDHHIPPAKKAADAGCDVFVEKPLSNNSEGVNKLVKMLERKDIVSMIGCNYRFHPAIKTVKRLLDEGAIGNVVSAQIEMSSHLPDWHPWEDYREMYSAKDGVGGALLDFIHGINYGRWFFSDAQLVSGMLNQNSSLEIETEDTVSLIVEHEDMQCEYHFDYVQRTPTLAGHITGEKGSIRWGGTEEKVYYYSTDSDDWTVEETYSGWELNEMYIDMTNHFLNCVEGRKKTISPISDGWKDLQLALAAKESNRKNKHIEL